MDGEFKVKGDWADSVYKDEIIGIDINEERSSFWDVSI